MISQGIKMVSLISGYVAQATSGKVLFRDDEDRLRFFIENVSRWCQRAMNTLHFSIQTRGLEKLDLKNKNYLFVANHLSYVDILVFSSKLPSVFVSSVDMGEVFFLGTMAELGGSIFVERRNRNQIDRDLSAMTETLKKGFNIVIFPEGTSTDGGQILPFKKSLLFSAVEAEREIVPVAIKYMTVDGKPFCRENADKMAWYGDMTFAEHFAGLLKLKKVEVVLDFLEPIQTSPGSTRTELAEKAWSAIQDAYFEERSPEFFNGFGIKRAQMALAEKKGEENKAGAHP